MIDSFELEVTARCNLDCRHCAIVLPEADRAAKKSEPGVGEIDRLAAEAAALGAGRCRITGGEPFLRKDFRELYQAVLSKGLRVSLATNATLVTDDDVRFLRKFPPQDIEVTVFGLTRETYERVTRRPGSFAAFKSGLDRLLAGGINVRLKAMALRSNKHELAAIRDFCRTWAKEAYGIDPHLYLRFDRNESRNALIRAERLSPREIVRLERSGLDPVGPLSEACAEDPSRGPAPAGPGAEGRRLFRCGAGSRSFVIGPTGLLRPCPTLHHPDLLHDLRKGSLGEGLSRIARDISTRVSGRREFPDECGPCPVADFCRWCPGRAFLESGELDLAVEDICRVAEARADGL